MVDVGVAGKGIVSDDGFYKKHYSKDTPVRYTNGQRKRKGRWQQRRKGERHFPGIQEQSALSMESIVAIEKARKKEEQGRKKKEEERKRAEEELELIFNVKGNKRRNSDVMRTPPKSAEEESTLYHTPIGGRDGGEVKVTKEIRVELQRLTVQPGLLAAGMLLQRVIIAPALNKSQESSGAMNVQSDREEGERTLIPSSAVRTPPVIVLNEEEKKVGSSASPVHDVSDTESLASAPAIMCEASVHLGQKRKRSKGRPETTRAFRLKKLRQEEEAAFQQTEKERAEEEKILNENLPLKLDTNPNRKLPTVEDILENMCHCPTPDITAEAMKQINSVARVAQVATNLKSSAKSVLNLAVLNARAALTTLAIRAQQLGDEDLAA